MNEHIFDIAVRIVINDIELHRALNKLPAPVKGGMWDLIYESSQYRDVPKLVLDLMGVPKDSLIPIKPSPEEQEKSGVDEVWIGIGRDYLYDAFKYENYEYLTVGEAARAVVQDVIMRREEQKGRFDAVDATED